MKLIRTFVLALALVLALGVPADAHRLSRSAATSATERLGNAAAKRIDALPGGEVIGRTHVGECRSPHATRRHRHRIVCTWSLHVQYAATDSSGNVLAGVPISHLTCLADVIKRIGRKAKQNDRSVRCRVRGQPRIPVNHRKPANVGLQDLLPGYDVDRLERHHERHRAFDATRLSLGRAVEQRRRNALTHSVPRGVRSHIQGTETLTRRDLRRAYVATEGAGKLAAAIRGGRRTLTNRRARGSVFGIYDGTVSFDAEQESIIGLVASLYQDSINSIGGAYGYDGNVDFGYANEGNLVVTACGTVVMPPNMFYCSSDDSVTVAVGLAQYVFATWGDGAFAGFIAHEFGHGAQLWLGWPYTGALYYELYREGLADCFAGAWYYLAFYYGYLDFGGYGGAIDTGEYMNALDTLNAYFGSVTTLDSHGDNDWRNAWVEYGWNNGVEGCGVLANSWSNGIT